MAVCSLLKNSPLCQLLGSTFSQPKDNSARKLKDLEVWLCNFHRIYKTNMADQEVIHGFKPRDILHSIAGLFLVCLQSMDKETVYDVLSQPNSFSLVCLSRENDATTHIYQYYNRKVSDGTISFHSQMCHLSTDPDVPRMEEQLRALRKEMSDISLDKSSESSESDSSVSNDFKMVYPSEFSDSSDENSSAEPDDNASSNTSCDRKSSISRSSSITNGEDPPDMMQDYKVFIGKCIHRNVNMLNVLKSTDTEEAQDAISAHISVENMIAAACVFRIRYPTESRRIIHITLLAVRRYLRRKEIGSSIINLLKQLDVVGPYDAIVVHADVDAQKFFESLGFTDDSIINHCWQDFADEYTNCKLMTYLPAFSGSNAIPDTLTDKSHWEVNLKMNFEKWRKKAESAHSAQFMLYRRIEEDMKKLHITIEQRDCEISDLYKELLQAYTKILTRCPQVDPPELNSENEELNKMYERKEKLQILLLRKPLVDDSHVVALAPVDQTTEGVSNAGKECGDMEAEYELG